ncbi:hypothetical protein EW145_g71 [Phellinidium pouzarii]|uniref:Ras GEF n=1 Tax=Phellinidium pouzarii TaxID=167371 RepID=A0A4S4LJV0_9AGAM|nr:hypothetical protein EW145_g71 [Phellinidium pouzarii]
MSERRSPNPGLPGNIRLPTIPTLPPIQIPRSSLQSSLSALSDGASLNVSESYPKQILSPKLSEESFTTACTSPVVTNETDSFTAEVLNATHSMHGNPSLRTLPKSLSIDSFVREQQQHRENAATEPVRAGALSKSHNRLSSIDPSMERRRSEQASERESPGSPPTPKPSVAPNIRTLGPRRSLHDVLAEDEYESSTYEDSEFEQGYLEGRAVGRVGDMRRRLVPPPKRAGSMPVSKMSNQPSVSARTRKVPGASHYPVLSNINTSITSVRSSATPEWSPLLRSKISVATPLDAVRSRSRSIGTQSDDAAVRNAKSMRPLSTELENPPKDVISMTLAIIGSQGCGKSSFIRRAWKNARISEAERHTVSAKDSDGSRVIHYVLRKVFSQANEGRDYYLTLIEISVQELEHVDGELHDDVWPDCLPKVDGVFVLYDASDRASFIHIEELIRGYYTRMIPYIVLACKSDLLHRIPPADAINVIFKYDGGIVEISNNDSGREKSKRCVGVLLRGVMRRRLGDVDPRVNPCSPGLYNTNTPIPWEITPSPLTASSTTNSTSAISTPTSATASGYPSTDIIHPPPQQIPLPPPPSFRNIPSLTAGKAPPMASMSLSTDTVPTVSSTTSNLPPARSPSAPTSPTRARSMSDILAANQKSGQTDKQHEFDPELNRSKSIIDLAKISSKSSESVKSTHASPNLDQEPVITLKRSKQIPPAPWSTIEELLDKLFFLAVSEDDPSFIAHFFLTYRRFTTPRRILLAMQKRMIELNQPCADPTLAAFAQMRICNLLEQWIHDYPADFAVPGTAGALNALIRQILRQTHTLYYGSDFLPFVEMLPTLQDEDGAWAVKVETTITESDESDSNYESEGTGDESPSTSPNPHSVETPLTTSLRPITRERKSSIPLSAKAFLQGTLPSSVRVPGPHTSSPSRDSVARLLRTSNALLHFDSEDIAKEITRRELELYMKIEPRDWLRHTLVSGKKDPNEDRIARFNNSYNELHDWAASMVLCHDKTKPRARAVEKLAEVALKLRNMNNYSALRAIITAITQSTYPNDEVMEIFKTKVDLHKKYLSSDILMRTAGAHQAYRLALRNTKGPCIPCLEVHTSDLRRAHEGNPDYKADDPSRIHWAKFSMIGKFISTTTQLQWQCRGQNGYQFPENALIGQLFDVPVMDYDMQQERLGPPPDEDDDLYSTPLPPTLAFDHSGNARDPGVIRRLFFWS